MKVMAAGLQGGTSFMEDYTYHLDPAGMKVLGAHMLEICPSIAAGKPSLEIHPLGIGGKDDPVRLVFDAPAGPAINASIIDLGNRFRLIVNEVDVVPPEAPLPKLPVARAVWMPQPNLEGRGRGVDLRRRRASHRLQPGADRRAPGDFAEMAGLECVVIDEDTKLREFKKELRWNEAYYHLAKGIS